MKHPVNSANVHQQTTYQLLVQSEEKERNCFETLAYFLLIIATAASIWQFSHQPVTFTGIGMAASREAAHLQSAALES
jgi:hypothetical protein